MSEVHKLSFLSTYGSDAHKAKVQPKVDALIKQAHDEPWHEEAEETVKSGFVKGHHLDGFLNSQHSQHRRWAGRNPNLTDAHIDHIAAHGEYNQRHGLMTNTDVRPKIKSEHLDGMIRYQLKDGERVHPAQLLPFVHAEKLSSDQHRALAMHPDPLTAKNAVGAIRMPINHLLHAMQNHPDHGVRENARYAYFQRTKPKNESLLNKVKRQVL
jgi:hypothetical protein